MVLEKLYARSGKMARIGYVINYFPRLCVPAVFSSYRVGSTRNFFEWYLWRVNMGLFGNPFDFSVRGFTSFVIPTISAKLATSALFELRRDLTNHILQLPQSYFDKTSSGDLILRLVNQVQELTLSLAKQQ